MITQLSIENFMRIKAVEIRPDGSLVQITGKNGAGKSAVLNAIQAVLGGKGAEPPDPIHHGADSGRIAVLIDVQCPDCDSQGSAESDDGVKHTKEEMLPCETCTGTGRIDKYRVEKIFENGTSKLVVTSPDGKIKFSSPQALLNALYSDIGFDPAALLRMKRADRDEMFRELVGLDFADIEARITAAFDTRTDIGRAVRTVEAQIKDLPEVEAPDVAVKLTDLLAERDAAHQKAYENQQRDDKIRRCMKVVGDLAAHIECLQEELAGEKQNLDSARGSSAHVLPDIDEITEKINSAQMTNHRVRQRQSRQAKLDQLRDLRDQEAGLTHEVEALRSDKRNLIEAAEMPIEGLDYGDDGITYNGVPLEQASQSEQLLVWTAIGLALNPGGVVLIREGSFLDTEHLAELEDFVEANGGCVWLERVTDGQNVGVVIEEGRLAGAEELQTARA